MKRVVYKPFINKAKLNKNGETLVMVEAYQGGKRKYFSTGVHIKTNQWSEKKQLTNDPLLNRKIREKINDLQRYEDEVWITNKEFSLSDFEGYKNPDTINPIRPLTFVDFYANELKLEKIRLATKTFSHQNKCLEYFKEFGGERYKWNLTVDMLQRWDDFLRTKLKKITSVESRHKQLSKYINRAIAKEFISQSPYKNKAFKVARQNTNPTYLTAQEREKFEELKFTPEQRLECMARDMYLLGCYTSLRISDVVAIGENNFTETPEGLRMTINVEKGHQRDNKKWEYILDNFYDGKAAAIIRKYWRTDGKRFFYGMTSQKANTCLKALAKRAGINKYLTFHSSRHTFGSHAVLIMPVIDVKKIMQHASITMTEKYLHLNNTEHKERLKITKWK